MPICIITGASSGLGAGFAKKLASKYEFSEMWLIARRLDRLEALAAELKHINDKCVYRPMSVDLTDEDALCAWEKLVAEEKPEIGWLVNAAGLGKIGKNEALTRKELDSMILLNDKAAVDVTQICLPYVIRKGRIIEICSTAGFQPLPALSVYAASKAFLISYTRSLKNELRYRRIHVTAVCPYWVKDTEFIPVAKDNSAKSRDVRHFPLAQKTKNVVRNSIAGANIGVGVTTPGFVSTIHHFFAKLIPHWIMMEIWNLIRRL